jgi:signal transduction histidine kinase
VSVNRAFTQYVAEQGKARGEGIASDIERYYNSITGSWNVDYLHIIGMYSMYDGYVLKIFDRNGNSLWDAENHDCWHIMEEITGHMQKRGTGGGYITNIYDLDQNGHKIGSVSVTYFGPYFLSEVDYTFIRALNAILLAIGVLAGVFAVFVGILLARKITRPISKTAQIAMQIAEGNYKIRFERNTKTKELNDLATAINYLAGALNEQENLRRRLTTDMAHELRTPLTAVGSHLEAMIMGLWEATPERLQGCHDEVKRLESLVADLGRLSKIEDDNLKLNKTTEDLLNIAQTVADNMKAEIDKKALSLSVVGVQAFVEADKDRMNQVIANLLSNAVKYTPSGGSIQMEVSDSAKYGVIKVKDNGIGISEQELPLIFERFYRTENSRSRKSGGAGIGLTIVKSIVMAHGGTVSAESKPDVGSCFTVQIPKGHL